MFKNRAFLARFLRLLGAVLVISTGYFVYLDNELYYADATIIQYQEDHPIVHFATKDTQITSKLEKTFNSDQFPIGSTLLMRYPQGEFDKMEYVSPLMQWAFYIVLFIGLVIFFIGAVLTLKLRKQNNKDS